MSHAANQPVATVPRPIALGPEPGADLVEGDRDRKLEPIVQSMPNQELVRKPIVIQAKPKTDLKDDDRTPKNTNIAPN